MEEAFIAQLLSVSGVTALVGQRVYMSVAPQDAATPRVIIHTISRQPVYHTEGQADLAEARVQVDCWATSGLAALRVARAVKAAIPKRPFARNGIDFQSVTQISERTFFSDESPTSRLHRVSIDFRAWHTQP